MPRKINDCGGVEKSIEIRDKYNDVRQSETVWSEKQLLNSIGIGVQDQNGLIIATKELS